jgi:hypothetical protein
LILSAARPSHAPGVLKPSGSSLPLRRPLNRHLARESQARGTGTVYRWRIRAGLCRRRRQPSAKDWCARRVGSLRAAIL